jgi:hypothetical protein
MHSRAAAAQATCTARTAQAAETPGPGSRRSGPHSHPGPGSTAGKGVRKGELTRPHPNSAAATLSQDRSLCPPPFPDTATPPSSSPGTSAVELAVLPLPVIDVAVGILLDACPRAAARLDFLSFLLITGFPRSTPRPRHSCTFPRLPGLFLPSSRPVIEPVQIGRLLSTYFCMRVSRHTVTPSFSRRKNHSAPQGLRSV